MEQQSQAEYPVMTAREAAEMLGANVFEIRRMVAAGQLWGKKIGGCFFLDRKEIKARASLVTSTVPAGLNFHGKAIAS